MPRVYESHDLTKQQADESAQAAKDDIPPALDVQEIAQPGGLYTVIATYADVDAASPIPSQPSGGTVPAPARVVPSVSPPAAPAPAVAPATTPAIPPVGSLSGSAPPSSGVSSLLTLAMLEKHWPHADAGLRQGMATTSAAVFGTLSVNTPLRVAHFMAQISEECGAGVEMVENLNYTHAQRIMAVWPSRFPTYESALPYVGNARALADKVYNGRMENAVGTDDGFNFRGRGGLQLTGRDSYTSIGPLCSLDLVGNPDLACDPQNTLLVAATEFVKSGCLPWCDHDNVVNVSALVNLGHLVADSGQIIGLDDRKAWLKVWKSELGLSLIPALAA